MNDRRANVSRLSSSECFGCSACMTECPVGAINMVSDDEGFLVPYVDESRCISCGKCTKVCPALNRWKKKEKKIRVFAAKNKDFQILENSTSGGMFRAMADAVLSMGGYVCGCVIDEKMQVRHIVSNDITVVERMMGSKYVQSNMGDCFQVIKKHILENRIILFSGTSCQVHGLINFVDNNHLCRDNLICVDLVCHGVPSPLVFSDYIEFYMKTRRVNVIDYRFRSKKYGWGTNLGEKNYISTVWNSDMYKDDKSYCGQLWKNVFFSDWCIRGCCYECPYTCVSKPADISIGDFWGIEKYSKNIDWTNGCSLIIPQTDQGYRFMKQLDAVVYEIEVGENSLGLQKRLFMPINEPKDREKFWEEYKKNGFYNIAKKYFRYNTRYKIRYQLKIFLINHKMERIAERLIKDIFY